jgi:hypothetical protein
VLLQLAEELDVAKAGTEAVVLATTQPCFNKATVERARAIVERRWRPLEPIESLKRNPD